MSAILDKVREKYPQYNNISDDDLTLRLGEKYPVYLDKDSTFRSEFNRVQLRKTSEAGDTELTKTYQPDVIKPLPATDIRDVTKGGPPVQPGSMATALEYAGETATTPVTSLAEPFTAEEMQGFTKGQKIASGAYNALADTANFFTSPLGITTLGIGSLPAAAQRLIAGGFAAHMASQTPELARELGEEMAKPESERDVAKISELVTGAGLNTFMATMAGKHAIKPGVPSFDLGKPTLPDVNVEAMRSVAPLTAKALEETVPKDFLESAKEELPKTITAAPETVTATLETKGPENAVQPEATQPVRPVQSQPGQGPGEVPAQGSGPPPDEGGGQAPAAEASKEVIDPSTGIPSFGAAVYGEFGDPGNPDIHGIAERVRAERAKAGQTVPIETGQGVSALDAVVHGQDVLANNPTAADKAVADFQSSKAVSFEGITVTRAKGEEAFRNARRIEEQFGTDSPEYKAAFNEAVKWDKASKEMQTEWHKTGQAQQGQVDIDTGTFTGLQREYKNITDKDFNPSQAGTAKVRAKKVKAANEAESRAKARVIERISGKDQPDMTKAEKRAFDAAKKTVREAAIRMAEAENKTRVARTVAERETAKIQETEARKALEAAQKQAREAAVRLAKSEREAASKKPTKLNQQDIATKKALDAASEVVTRAAAKAAEAERKLAASRTDRERKIAAVQKTAAEKALKAAQERKIKAATKAAEAARKLQDDPMLRVWDKAKEYIEKGINNFDDLRNKVATDLGMKVGQVTRLLAQDARTKYLADDMWRKQQAARRLREQAKQWVRDQAIPGWARTIASVPRTMFSMKVGFHGTVALGTHAPMVAFMPRYWNAYVRNFAKMYRMVGSKSFYEMQVQDLQRKPTFTMWNRAGLVNDPFQFEELQKSGVVADLIPEAVKKAFNAMSAMGNRGYAILKILRQDMADQQWARLPKNLQTPDVAQAIADGVNHITGVTKGKAPPGSNVALFAPRLLASRAMVLAGDPFKALYTAATWKDATPGERYFAINQVKEKAWVLGTLYGLLAANQGFLSATGSKQKINGIPEIAGGKGFDPMRSDFFKFKVAGMNVSYGNAMINMARLPVRLYQIRSSDGGKLKNLVYPDESSYSVLGEFARTQLSPFASLASTLWFKGDWQNRPLPSSDRPVPKRLRAQGVEPYTWPEFFVEQTLPIPLEEAVREVWKTGMGMSEEQIQQLRKAMATIAVMSATGARLTDDTDVEK